MGNVRNRVAVVAATVSLVVGWGCGDGKPPVSTSTTEATVKGAVTVNGKPVTKGQVVFDPANYLRKDATVRTAPIDKDGKYTITTMVGGNTVRVDSPEVAQASSSYSTINYDVKPGENTFDISLGQGK